MFNLIIVINLNEGGVQSLSVDPVHRKSLEAFVTQACPLSVIFLIIGVSMQKLNVMGNAYIQ